MNQYSFRAFRADSRARYLYNYRGEISYWIIVNAVLPHPIGIIHPLNKRSKFSTPLRASCHCSFRSFDVAASRIIRRLRPIPQRPRAVWLVDSRAVWHLVISSFPSLERGNFFVLIFHWMFNRKISWLTWWKLEIGRLIKYRLLEMKFSCDCHLIQIVITLWRISWKGLETFRNYRFY